MTSDATGERLTAALAGRYAIERELGQGGMAIVYLARDLRHERVVALKVLRPELSQVVGRERFFRETRTTAQLTHPHILPLLDSGDADGTLFYVMPYVDGESLRGRLDRERQLPIADALRITREVADALSYAHGQGVLHRDIKPENILLEAGHAVVADFGIARAINQAADGEHLTGTGIALGTPAYMSPEQCAGDMHLDGRSDVYALGCVLYEMLSGETPYTGPTAQAILAKKLSAPVPRLSILRETVPAGVEAAVNKALARTPADRWTTAAEFATVLEHPEGVTAPRPAAESTLPRRTLRLASMVTVPLLVVAAIAVGLRLRPVASPSSHRVAIAVLPPENLSAQGPYGYFAGGLHSELITQLTKVGALSPSALTSVAAYAGTTKPVRQIAEELAVDRIVELSVQVVGNRLRANVRLVDPSSGSTVWAETFDRTLDDAFAVQSAIAQQIVQRLGVTVSRAEAGAIAAAPTANPEAYRLFLQAEELRQRPCCERRILESAVQYYERALALDPDFALGHASLAFVHGWIFGIRMDPSPQRAARLRTEAETALRLAPDLPQAHLAMGAAYFWLSNGALSALRRALRETQVAAEGMPGSADVWNQLSGLYWNVGDTTAGAEADRRWRAVDPRNVDYYLQTVGNGSWLRHRYAEALAGFDTALILGGPDVDWPRGVMAYLHVLWSGRLDSMRAFVARAGCSGDRYCVQLLLWERRPDSLLAVLPQPRRVIFDNQYYYEPASLYAGWAHRLRGDTAAARVASAGALAQLDSALRAMPDDWRLHRGRGLALAGMDRNADARREAEWLLHSVDSLGALWAIWRRDAAALIFAQSGFADDALSQIERQLAGESWDISGPMLRIDPRYDRIRSDPRFQALVLRYGGQMRVSRRIGSLRPSADSMTGVGRSPLSSPDGQASRSD